MARLTKSDFEYLDEMYAQWSKQDCGFNLHFHEKDFIRKLYVKKAESINRLVNSGLLKITKIETDNMRFRAATPTEIIEWKCQCHSEKFDIFKHIVWLS